MRVRASLMAQIDVARGERNRSEWARESLRAVIAGDPRVSAGPPLEDPSAGVITGLSDAEVDGFVAAVSEGREPAPAKPRRRAAAPRTVTPAAPGVPPTAFQEPAPAPVRRPRCTHPGTRVIGGFCKECDVVVGQGGVLPDGWAAPDAQGAF